MDGSQDQCNAETSGDARRERVLEQCSSPNSGGSGYRLFDRERSIYQIMGGGRAADVILWKYRSISVGIIVFATVVWLLYEFSGLSFLSISSDLLLILIVVLFIRANSAAYLNKQLRPLPELVLSEEMVHNAAASFRVKINYFLLMAHDITLGKDFRLFFKVVVGLWLFSVIGSFFSFFTLVYIDSKSLFAPHKGTCMNMDNALNDFFFNIVCATGTVVSITIPALYNKYEERVDRYAGVVHSKISKHYNTVDANVISRIPGRFSKNKDS